MAKSNKTASTETNGRKRNAPTAHESAATNDSLPSAGKFRIDCQVEGLPDASPEEIESLKAKISESLISDILAGIGRPLPGSVAGEAHSQGFSKTVDARPLIVSESAAEPERRGRGAGRSRVAETLRTAVEAALGPLTADERHDQTHSSDSGGSSHHYKTAVVAANVLSTMRRPMNVVVERNSAAAKAYLARAGTPGTGGRVKGVSPTPPHDLHFHGGRTIPNLSFYSFYIGGVGCWNARDIQIIDGALASAMEDRNLNNVMTQYFTTTEIGGSLAGSEILEGNPPKVVSKGDVQALLRELYVQGKLDNLEFTTTAFNFLLPSGTTLSDDTSAASAIGRPIRMPKGMPSNEDDSLSGLAGYHGSIHIADGTEDVIVYYAVAVYSELLPDGLSNGIIAFDEPWKNLVATAYHELNEVRTDPDVEDAILTAADAAAVSFLGWTSDYGEECGDFPIQEGHPRSKVFQEVALSDGSGIVPVQFLYSNAVHGPEGPRPEPYPPMPSQ
jgi:hypothetical protein